MDPTIMAYIVQAVGGAVAGNCHDQARRGEIVGMRGVALQRAAEGDERGLDVIRPGELAQAVEQRLEREGEPLGKELAHERAPDDLDDGTPWRRHRVVDAPVFGRQGRRLPEDLPQRPA